MALPDDKKQPFLDAALEDKRRYKLEMKEYNKKLVKKNVEIKTHCDFIVIGRRNQYILIFAAKCR